MPVNENYEELKESTKTVLQMITSDDLYYGLVLLGIMIILLKLIDLIFYPFRHKTNILVTFGKGCLKVFVAVTIGMRILQMIPGMSEFTSQILMSSSLLVVVLGFVFQEGLSNIVHGLILSVFKPFKNGDRVHITIDGEGITGFIVSMDARHTVIQNVVNSSRVIVPNSKMDMCLIENNYFDGNQTASSFLDVRITYESNLDKAMDILASLTANHPHVRHLRDTRGISDPISVNVRELGESAISLRVMVVTLTVDENFAACSDIRHDLVYAYRQEPDIEIAYPHLKVLE